jgi:hypothetical protein
MVENGHVRKPLVLERFDERLRIWIFRTKPLLIGLFRAMMPDLMG